MEILWNRKRRKKHEKSDNTMQFLAVEVVREIPWIFLQFSANEIHDFSMFRPFLLFLQRVTHSPFLDRPNFDSFVTIGDGKK